MGAEALVCCAAPHCSVLPFLVRIEVIVSSPGRDGKRETEVWHRDRQRQKHREGEKRGGYGT